MRFPPDSVTSASYQTARNEDSRLEVINVVWKCRQEGGLEILFSEYYVLKV